MSKNFDGCETIFEEQATIRKRNLKELGSRAIEDAIEKTICDLADAKYCADITSIDFGSLDTEYETVEISLRLKKEFIPTKFPFPLSEES